MAKHVVLKVEGLRTRVQFPPPPLFQLPITSKIILKALKIRPFYFSHGWLVSYLKLARGMVYVPDEKHEWKVNK